MPDRFYIRSVSGSRNGVALLLVLAFIVLLTILIVSFISFSRLNRMSTASYSQTIQAQEIAQGGIEDILSDFHQEIVAGSTLQNGGSSSYAPVYIPITNWTAQPARLGYNPAFYGPDVTSTNLPPTLVRVSRASQDVVQTHLYPPLNTTYYPGTLPLNRASKANTSTNSINGRNVSATRWNKIALLATNNVIAPAFSTNTPDWVYVTRSGSQALTSVSASIEPSSSLTTTTAVVGRYAYAVYDEGALLDVNAAGYVSAATNSYAVTPPATIYTDTLTGISQVIAGKTYTSYADITQLPGFTGAQTAVDSLIQWRNASGTFTGSSGGVNFYQAAFTNAKTGFKTFASGDSPLLSRQDLINYFAQIDPGGNSYSAALPFLGTFSRAKNAPSWSPPLDSSSITPNKSGFTGIATVAYHTNAETAPNANRDLPNVRYPASTLSATTITHLADDGTSSPYSVNPGDALVQHRFSLAKLSWLTYKGPSALNGGNSGGTVANIETCFGLVWTTNPEGNPCWKYDAGTTGPAAIQTLDQVAAGSAGTAHPGYREPNFFEMLKAGILSGSLGQSPGPVVGIIGGNGAGNPSPVSGGSSNVEGVAGLNFDQYSPDKERHILQIGANIIDQSDSDSYPTAIYMNLVAAPTLSANPDDADDLCLNTVYGDENLPSISRVYGFSVETPSTFTKTWLQPELWNIHQAPGTNVTLTNTPTKFRLHVYGKLHVKVGHGGSIYDFSPSLDYGASTTYTYHDNSGAAQTPQGTAYSLIYFNDPNSGSAASPFYSNPVRLSGSLSSITFPSTTTPINLWGQLGNVTNVAGDSGSTNADEKFAAFLAGETLTDMTSTTDPVDWPEVTNFTTELVYCYPENPLYFSIEYQDPNNANGWLPYSFISRVDEQTSFNTQDTMHLGSNNHPDNYGPSYPTQGATYPFWSLARPDPRTDRFSCMEVAQPGNGRWQIGSSIDAGPGAVPQTGGGVGGPQGTSNEYPAPNYGFVYYPTPAVQQGSGPQILSFWAENQPGSLTANAYYVDPDAVIRPGDGYRRDPGAITYSGSSATYVNTATGDGSPLYNGFAQTNPTSTFPTALAASPSGSAQARRPLILNRPFRSVGELGYVFRDVPLKSLDFFSAQSGDAALLDLFSVADEPTVAAGEVNLSNSPASVMKALLAGTTKMEINNPASGNASSGSPNFLTAADASAVASAITSYLSPSGVNGPLTNRADLVTKLSNSIFNSLWSSTGANASYANKAYAEAPVRALSDVASTRTWNLLIDIVAQSGFMAPKAGSLNDFVVQGERRYWLHVAIDRYTGKIIDQQLEPVYE